MTAARTIAGGVAAAILAAAALVAPNVATFEGVVKTGYRDPIGIVTACAGHTATAELGRKYSDAECDALLAEDLVEHGADIAACLPADLPVKVRGAFTSFAFNVGARKFCGSGAAQAARAGDLSKACRRINEADNGRPQWITAGGRVLAGLVTRRAWERRLCEEGLL